MPVLLRARPQTPLGRRNKVLYLLCTFHTFGLISFLRFELFLQHALAGGAMPVFMFSHNIVVQSFYIYPIIARHKY